MLRWARCWECCRPARTERRGPCEVWVPVVIAHLGVDELVYWGNVRFVGRQFRVDCGDIPPPPPANGLVGVAGNHYWGVQREVENAADVSSQLRGTEHFPVEAFSGADQCGGWPVHHSPRLGRGGGSRYRVVDGSLEIFPWDPLVSNSFGPVHNDVTVGDEGRIRLAPE